MVEKGGATDFEVWGDEGREVGAGGGGKVARVGKCVGVCVERDRGGVMVWEGGEGCVRAVVRALTALVFALVLVVGAAKGFEKGGCSTKFGGDFRASI